MPRSLTQEIQGIECIGDSLQTKINPNFLKLDEAVQTLSSTFLIPVDTSTVDLTFNTTNRQLNAVVKNDSITNAKLAFDGGSLGFRNKIINGNFDIWQRGTSYTGNATAPALYPAADRWSVYVSIPAANSPVGTYTVTRRTTDSTELLSFQANYYQRLQTNFTTFGTTPMNNYLGSAAIVPGIQGIERAASILGKTVTVSFWARASQNCKLLSESQIYSQSNQIFWTPTICKIFDVTTSWQKFTHTYTMPTYNQVIAAGYDPFLNFVANPSYTPLGNAMPPLSSWLYQVNLTTMWSRGLYNAAGNHSNRPTGFPDPLSVTDFQALSASAEATKNGGWVDVAQVQLEEGPTATPFEQRPLGLELSLCQRYFQSYPGNITNAGYTTNGTAQVYTMLLPTPMRVSPTINFTPLNVVNATLAYFDDGGSNDRIFFGVFSTSPGGGVFQYTAQNATLNAEL